ncbi:symmetrical bis(5'-nucleosyl)-tetraphosphatase [Sulfuricaulis sp.]|jgi:bis(5'-nucleosyl)-tetraphosphatase (symmetrical)|uniref:symmetrical bis(5'-nucleosyl)-tetraphosphatase n=1 Tax=Sulfuricaulis sp. TaxID=2003553 RepID=UPI00355A374E
MAVYAIGDVQGCYPALMKLLTQIGFDPDRDRLWFTGDLVNRGPRSLEVLQFVKGLGERAECVLGNHDLHLLAVAAGAAKLKKRDTLDDILQATDRNELLHWLRMRPLLHQDDSLGYTLIHAGLLPPWNLADARRLAHEAETVLRGDKANEFFHRMYGDLPDHWNENLRGVERLRVIINAFTRLRYCDLEGNMDLRPKGPPGTQPPDLMPWFQVPGRRSQKFKIIFGHWSALGLWHGDGVIGLDSGCLWGHSLSAVRLDTSSLEFFSVDCEPYLAHDGG